MRVMKFTRTALIEGADNFYFVPGVEVFFHGLFCLLQAYVWGEWTGTLTWACCLNGD
jgi:hypothetical protein